ncbi:MAG: hypothetical protein ACW981_06985 [Candidatus Hodarchaeales archaeon]|jgi:hypothetical protein
MSVSVSLILILFAIFMKDILPDLFFYLLIIMASMFIIVGLVPVIWDFRLQSKIFLDNKNRIINVKSNKNISNISIPENSKVILNRVYDIKENKEFFTGLEIVIDNNNAQSKIFSASTQYGIPDCQFQICKIICTAYNIVFEDRTGIIPKEHKPEEMNLSFTERSLKNDVALHSGILPPELEEKVYIEKKGSVFYIKHVGSIVNPLSKGLIAYSIGLMGFICLSMIFLLFQYSTYSWELNQDNVFKVLSYIFLPILFFSIFLFGIFAIFTVLITTKKKEMVVRIKISKKLLRLYFVRFFIFKVFKTEISKIEEIQVIKTENMYGIEFITVEKRYMFFSGLSKKECESFQKLIQIVILSLAL